MRLINDPKTSSQSKEPMNLALVPFYSLFCAVGFSTFIFSPLAVILAHRRLPDFWPKVVSLAGAVLALILFDAPVPSVLVSFVLGLFVADGIQKQVPVWKLMVRSGILIAAIGLIGLLSYTATLNQSNPWRVWVTFIEKVLEQARKSPLASGDWNWETTKELLLYQGPFYFISGNLLSVWLSLGLSAHLGWAPESDIYSSKNLRKLQLPRLLGPVIMLCWAGSVFLPTPAKYFASGVVNCGLVFLSFQGFLVLSALMEPKKWAKGVRMGIYLGFILVGFYALVGLGLISPSILTKRRVQSEVLEESI